MAQRKWLLAVAKAAVIGAVDISRSSTPKTVWSAVWAWQREATQPGFGLDGRQVAQDVGPQFLVRAFAGLQDGRLGRAVVLVAGTAGLRVGRDALANLRRPGPT